MLWKEIQPFACDLISRVVLYLPIWGRNDRVRYLGTLMSNVSEGFVYECWSLIPPYVLLRHNMLITITNFDTSCSLFRVSIVKPRLWKHWTITLNYINPITRIYSILAVRPHNDNRCTLPVTWCDEAGTFMLSRSVGASRPFWVESDEWGACRHVNRYFYISHQRSRSLVLVFVFYQHQVSSFSLAIRRT